MKKQWFSYNWDDQTKIFLLTYGLIPPPIANGSGSNFHLQASIFHLPSRCLRLTTHRSLLTVIECFIFPKDSLMASLPWKVIPKFSIRCQSFLPRSVHEGFGGMTRLSESNGRWTRQLFRKKIGATRTSPAKTQRMARISFDRINRIDRIDKKSIFCFSGRKAEGRPNARWNAHISYKNNEMEIRVRKYFLSEETPFSVSSGNWEKIW